ncbi:MAG: ubiquinol-cytochrome C chaperone [Devosiaceae bacterium]|nr:ubiquinol-cytochrome C chaperone [Devosiaceae bacterium]
MILSIFKKKPDARIVRKVYNDIVAQSRQKLFYADWGIPDSVNGRFDLISLHMCLVFRRLKTPDSEAKIFSQSLFDLFFLDMDRSLREMGAGDMAVPKRIQKMGELFYGMAESLNKALDEEDNVALQSCLVRNVYDGAQTPSLELLVQYVLVQSEFLASQKSEAIRSGLVEFKQY